MTKEERITEQMRWREMVKRFEAFPYFRATRRKHESGYKCFEVGYLTMDGNGGVKEKLILSIGSDHFWHKENYLTDEPPIEFSIDILKGNYFRIYPLSQRDGQITWENSFNWLVSTFSLERLHD